MKSVKKFINFYGMELKTEVISVERIINYSMERIIIFQNLKS